MFSKLSGLGFGTSLFVAACATVLVAGTANAAPMPDGNVTWRNVDVNQYLDVAGNSHSNGAWVITYKKTGGKNQTWRDHRLSNGNFLEQPQNTTDSSGNFTMCLDASGGRVDAAVIQWQCNGGSNQQWKEGKSNGHWYLQNQAHGQYLQSGGTNAQVIVRSDCDPCNSQLWD
ncbi:RICIN domain-containing protein [Nocardia pseudobrasiliensis]|uniref:Ricin-type beta-trefoil lectin protein n=1 Tax=Nocardia pseudobrasiliensis TaxID=45979 RepID=A0A370IIM7_9NOCA|nr:RICIN domain-containing protein [Nocardia pseudobrasiliensis]RDI69344.1 ricin-type beta-trefoil lectin protein [Nocardia pseudobrasiliensis]